MRVSRPQLNLLQLLLLITACGIWLWDFKLKLETERMQDELLAFEAYGQFLFVDDPNKLEVLEETETWGHEIVWQAYVPETGEYRLICCNETLAGSDTVVTLSPGISRVVLAFDEPLTVKMSEEYTCSILLSVNDSEYTLASYPYQQQKFTSRSLIDRSTAGTSRTADETGYIELLRPSGTSKTEDWSIRIERSK
ncbi:MAG: hypothetical protein ACE361_20080 [Aureliella sp.]